MCGGLDAMQTDYYSLYERYFAPRGVAMLTIDMPSVGFSSKWKLTQDSSLLHQHVLKALPNVPWVDHTASRPLVSVSALTLPCVWHTLNRRV